ncbi:hypothetical protein, partial [Paraburkholderia heleia]|uniref:hypothetical protein n=1 Tax=Paraburkholderia heleia TaxID=634127 RepID=UPI002AB74367
VFADGSTFNAASVTSQPATVTDIDTSAGGNFLMGQANVDNIIVGAANDMIMAGNLNDTITAGRNDTIYGGQGTDTYRIGPGTGAVTLDETMKMISG